MSTRACYTFKDNHETHHVYKHHDGYPSGAEQWIRAAIPFAWPLPRFEASEFGAAFIAANKRINERYPKFSGGGCYLMASGSIETVAPNDIEYRYEVEMKLDTLWVTAFKTRYWSNRTEEQLWTGPFDQMQAWVQSRN